MGLVLELYLISRKIQGNYMYIYTRIIELILYTLNNSCIIHINYMLCTYVFMCYCCMSKYVSIYAICVCTCLCMCVKQYSLGTIQCSHEFLDCDGAKIKFWISCLLNVGK